MPELHWGRVAEEGAALVTPMACSDELVNCFLQKSLHGCNSLQALSSITNSLLGLSSRKDWPYSLVKPIDGV